MRRSGRMREPVKYADESSDCTDLEDILPYTPARSTDYMISPTTLQSMNHDENAYHCQATSVTGPSIIEDRQSAASTFASKNCHYDPNRAGFMSLPVEIRLSIYKLVLVKKPCVDFGFRRNFAHSSAFLSVNKIVAEEAAVVLYGMNKFIFRPCKDKLGSYFDEEWHWLGYHGVLQFLTSIGPTNLGLLKSVGLSFQDAAPTDEPKLSAETRRFQHNIELFRSLGILGVHAIRLETLKLHFTGRAKFYRANTIATRNFSSVLSKLRSDVVIVEEIRAKCFTTCDLWPMEVRYSFMGEESSTHSWTNSWSEDRIYKLDQEYFTNKLTRREPLNARLRDSHAEGVAKAKKEIKKNGMVYW